MEICIVLKGGLVETILSTAPVKVIVVDQDSDSDEPWVTRKNVEITSNFKSYEDFSKEEIKELEKLQSKEKEVNTIPKDKQVQIDLRYTCASNYKTFFFVIVNIDDYPELRNLKEGDEITMGEYGTPPQDEFFNSDIHEYSYDPEEDHNILDITKIEFPKNN